MAEYLAPGVYVEELTAASKQWKVWEPALLDSSAWQPVGP